MSTLRKALGQVRPHQVNEYVEPVDKVQDLITEQKIKAEDYEAAMGIATSYEGWGDGYLNGVEGFDKNPSEAARYYRKAEKRVKSLMMTDIDNSNKYKKQLERVRYKRDVAEGN